MVDRHLIDIHVLLVRDDQVLLTRRRDSDPSFDGLWHLPSGKLDAGESALEAAARETEEEVGVLVQPADLCHVHTLHVNGSGPEPRLGLFFEARHWIGEPHNRPTSALPYAGFPSMRCLTSSSTTPLAASTPTEPGCPSASTAGPRMRATRHR